MRSMGEGHALLILNFGDHPHPSRVLRRDRRGKERRGDAALSPQLFFMFSSPLIPPGLVLGWLALSFGPLSALGLRASRLFFCWPLAIGCSDQGRDARREAGA